MNTKKKGLLVVGAILLCLLIALLVLWCLNRNADKATTPTEPTQHSHTFAEEWHSNETDHWQACSCGTKSDAFSHKFDEWVVTKEATEQEAGSKQRACTVCGYLEIVSLPTLSHEHAYNDSWKSNGTDHWHECVCGNKADSSAHKYGNWTITKEASEAKEGEQSRRCEICGYLVSKKIPVLSHSHKFDKENSNETSHWAECSCGEKADVNAHTFDEWIVTKEATETENGSRYHICTVCGYKETESIPKLPHNHTYGDWQQNSSSHWKECRCGEKSGVGTHSFGQWVVTKEATEEEEGSRYHICTVCGYKGTESIPKIPHSHAYGDWQQNSSSHWKECRCGEKSEVGTHSFGQWMVTKEATEEEEGSRYRACSVCGYTETESIPKLPHAHAYGDWKNNSSSHWNECRCGEKINVGEHSFGQWVVTKEATETEEGSRYRACSVCGYTETESIPKLPHTHAYGDWQHNSSSHWKECRCGTRSNEGSHSFGSWVVTQESTETTEGSRYRTCSVCSYKETATIPVKLIITAQPESMHTTPTGGWYPTLTVTCSGGSGRYYYKWQQKDGSSWKTVSTQQTYQVSDSIRKTRGVYTYRCLIEDSAGNSVISNTATLTVYNSPVVSCQKNNSAKTNKKITISVSITTDSLDPHTYSCQWYIQDGYETNSGSRYRISGNETYSGGKKYSGYNSSALTIDTTPFAHTTYFAFQMIGTVNYGSTCCRVEIKNIKLVVS